MTESSSTGLIRTFVAIPLDISTLNTIESIQQQLSPELSGVRWTRRDNIHLTLGFFGDISEESLEKAAEIMVSVGSLITPFMITLSEVGAFPSATRAQVVWVGVQSMRLEELHRSLQSQFLAAGLPIDSRPFRPHITIGRARRQTGRILSLRRHNVNAKMRVDELLLFESRLHSSGAEHRPRHTVRLAEPGRQN